MPRYRFLLDYRSHAGAWAAGDAADLSADLAAWLSRDSPGCIEEIVDAPEQPEEPEPTERALDAPPADRMVKNATVRERRRRRGNEGAMTTADFGAVKGGA